MELYLVLALAALMTVIALYWKGKAEHYEGMFNQATFDYSVLLKVTEELKNGRGKGT